MVDRIRFYLDQHVPVAVAQGLARRGVDVLTAQEAGRCGLSDVEQLQFALTSERVMVTFDDDFLTLANSGADHSGIVFCTATKYSMGQLIYALLLINNVLEPKHMRNHVEFL